MHKCMNTEENFIDECLAGIVEAYSGFYQFCDQDHKGIVHRGQGDSGHPAHGHPDHGHLDSGHPDRGHPDSGHPDHGHHDHGHPDRKVSIVTGGGSGHLPLFLGYVGDGLCDGVAVGNVFTSPSCETIRAVSLAVRRGGGILFLFGNYFGDSMNFEMAAELLAAEGIPTAIVKGADDIASSPRAQAAERRGIAGIALVYKLAGACADTGAGLAEVTRIAAKAAAATASFGVAFSSCTLPGADKPIFELDADDMEIGMGIHGEPGVRRGRKKSAAELTRELAAAIVADLALQPGDRAAVLVNGLGMTSREELFIVYHELSGILLELGVSVSKAYVGEYATSLEMAGLSLSMMKLDGELEALLDKHAYSPLVCF